MSVFSSPGLSSVTVGDLEGLISAHQLIGAYWLADQEP